MILKSRVPWRVFRGAASFLDALVYHNVAGRTAIEPSYRYDTLGFRTLSPLRVSRVGTPSPHHRTRTP